MKPLTNETLIEEFDERFGHWDVEWEMGCEFLLNNTDGKCNCEHDEIKKFILSAIQAKEREIQEKIIGEIEKRFKMFEQSKTGWMITGINIRLEDWKEFKSKLSNLSK